MDIDKLRFADLFKMEGKAAKVLIEALLEIHGKCKNPTGDIETDRHDCAKCVFEIRQNCGRLILDDWLIILGKKAMSKAINKL